MNAITQRSAPTLGAVIAVRGSVVDIRFDERLPSIYTLPSNSWCHSALVVIGVE
jgi:hypothetical protein